MRRMLPGLAVLLLVIGVTACGDARPTPEAEQAETASQESGAGTDDVAGTSRQVLVLGRSVMTGWMDHWGSEGSDTASLEGYTIRFREIEGPPGIARSAADAIAPAPAGSTVVFKFCFVDFNGGEYAGELDVLMEYVAVVADAADSAGARLILGTACPKWRVRPRRLSCASTGSSAGGSRDSQRSDATPGKPSWSST